MEFRMAVHNYDLIHIKEEVGAPRERTEFRVDMSRRLSIKPSPN
jgi:hypothetical protein